MNEPINPVAVENSIRSLVEEIARAIPVISNAEAKARAASRANDLAYARAYLAHRGPAHEKRYAAALNTEAERTAFDVADLAYRDAERGQKAREAQLRGWQSLGASVREMYSVGGHR